MGIRGVGASNGPTGPNVDPRAQALADTNQLQDLIYNLRNDLEKGDRSAAEKDLDSIEKVMNDLQSLSPQLPPKAQALINNISVQVDKIAGDMGQVSPEELDDLQKSVNSLQKVLS